MTDRAPFKIIKCFLPGQQHMAELIVKALEAEGYYICKMPGGVHERSCPTCGCTPVRARDGELAREPKEG